MGIPHLYRTIGTSLLDVVGWFACHRAFAQICTRKYMPTCGQVADAPAPRSLSNRYTFTAAQATLLANAKHCAYSSDSIDDSTDPSRLAPMSKAMRADEPLRQKVCISKSIATTLSPAA